MDGDGSWRRRETLCRSVGRMRVTQKSRVFSSVECTFRGPAATIVQVTRSGGRAWGNIMGRFRAVSAGFTPRLRVQERPRIRVDSAGVDIVCSTGAFHRSIDWWLFLRFYLKSGSRGIPPAVSAIVGAGLIRPLRGTMIASACQRSARCLSCHRFVQPRSWSRMMCLQDQFKR